MALLPDPVVKSTNHKSEQERRRGKRSRCTPQMAGYIIVAEKEQKRKTGEEDGKRVTGNATKRYS